MKNDEQGACTEGYVEVFCRYIVKGGKKIYPKKGQFFRFCAPVKKQA
ncbi:hypothetical protein [Adhaeribacter soli]|nr:hypothetical protein [Adhaeribacter soli]